MSNIDCLSQWVRFYVGFTTVSWQKESNVTIKAAVEKMPLDEAMESVRTRTSRVT